MNLLLERKGETECVENATKSCVWYALPINVIVFSEAKLFHTSLISTNFF